MSSQVTLHIYDLSSGLAAQLSGPLLNKQIKAVYHTGVVVYDIEYFYGGGIATGRPGQTPYGVPIERKQMGKTSKTLTEIAKFIAASDAEFSIGNYNPMTHNCNHFSNHFMKFLTSTEIPSEILAQPDEFLQTPLGKMVGGMMGFASEPNDYKKEETNKEYESLYIDEPKVFVAEDEAIIGYIAQLNKSANFGHHMNRLLAAVQDKKDYVVEKQFLEELKDDQPSVAVFDLLAMVCMTSSADNIPAAKQPFALIDSQMAATSEAFLRFCNNWFAEQVGMRDARIHASEWSAFLWNHMDKGEGQIALSACRAYYTFVRAQTYHNIKLTTPFPFLISAYQNYVQKKEATPKPWTVCVNLVCGCIGRLLLTVKPRDAGAYNTLRIKVQKEVDLEKMAGVKAPCVQDLGKLVGKKEVKKDDDDMF